MEYLITILPLIFSMLSGVLVAWGLQTITCLSRILTNAVSGHHDIRFSDLTHTTSIAFVTAGIIVVLFVIPKFAALHMATLVLMESWYSMYLFYVSEMAAKIESRLYNRPIRCPRHSAYFS